MDVVGMVVGCGMKDAPCMMDDRDGTGDDVRDRHTRRWRQGWCDVGAAGVAEVATVVEMGLIGCWTYGAERYPEMAGPGAGNAGIPP